MQDTRQYLQYIHLCLFFVSRSVEGILLHSCYFCSFRLFVFLLQKREISWLFRSFFIFGRRQSKEGDTRTKRKGICLAKSYMTGGDSRSQDSCSSLKLSCLPLLFLSLWYAFCVSFPFPAHRVRVTRELVIASPDKTRNREERNYEISCRSRHPNGDDDEARIRKKEGSIIVLSLSVWILWVGK